jgi:hypothetical protein
MAIKPIDLQTNMSQIHEVGKGEQARTEAVVEQQHVLEKESGEKSRLVNTKLDEMRKGESAVIKDQQKKQNNRREARAEEQVGARGKKSRKDRSVDDKMGQIIDILK